MSNKLSHQLVSHFLTLEPTVSSQTGPEPRSGNKNVNNMNIINCGTSLTYLNVMNEIILNLFEFPFVSERDKYVVRIPLKGQSIYVLIIL